MTPSLETPAELSPNTPQARLIGPISRAKRRLSLTTRCWHTRHARRRLTLARSSARPKNCFCRTRAAVNERPYGIMGEGGDRVSARARDNRSTAANWAARTSTEVAGDKIGKGGTHTRRYDKASADFLALARLARPWKTAYSRRCAGNWQNDDSIVLCGN